MSLILRSIEYWENRNECEDWRLDKFTLQQINLLVGRNATGKTRTLNIISALANLVSGDQKLVFYSGNYIVDFDQQGVPVKYELHYHDQKVLKEDLIIANEPVLRRGSGGVGTIKAVKLGEDMDFQTPENELACVARRDSIQHPFFEELYQWGKKVQHFHFGKDLGRNTFAIFQKNKKMTDEPNLKDTDKAAIVLLKKGLKKFGDSFKSLILEDMRQLNYDLAEIGTEFVPNVETESGVPGEVEGIFVKEVDLAEKIFQHQISQGMFRAISLIIQINYAQLEKSTRWLLIDDIGEGLDYERSTSLIKLLIEKAKQSSVQLIMSTNDRFVMNNVPLEYWAVIQRLGHRCKVFNYENSKPIFDDFQFTGLSNFDFLTTEFYLGGFDQE